MQYKTLGDLVGEALEEHAPSQGKVDRLKTSIEQFIAKHYTPLVVGSAIALAGLGYYIYGNAGHLLDDLRKLGPPEQFAHNPKFILEHAVEFWSGVGIIVGGGLGFISSALLLPSYVGKRIYSKLKKKEQTREEPEKEKSARIFRFPKTMALIGSTAYNLKMVLSSPARINELIETAHKVGNSLSVSKEYSYFVAREINNVAGFLIETIGLAAVFYIFRDFEKQGKKGLKVYAEYFRTLPYECVGWFSNDKKIELLKKAVKKRDKDYSKYRLGKALFKRNVDEGLDYMEEWIGGLTTQPHLKFDFLNNFMMGMDYSKLFKKKENWLDFFEFMIKIVKQDPAAAKKILDHVYDNLPREKAGEHYLLTRFYEKALNQPQPNKWAGIARDIVDLSAKDNRISEFRSSEGRVYACNCSDVIGKHLMVKDLKFDFFTRFLQQLFAYEKLNPAGKRTEQPLAFSFRGEENFYRALVTRVGERNLRAVLEQSTPSQRWKAFERVTYDGVEAQRILFESVRKENSHFFMDTSFAGKNYSVPLNVLNMKKELVQRAFLGDKERKNRFGKNEFLKELLHQLFAFMDETYCPILITVNRGDYFTTNITDQYASLDARYRVSDTPDDTAYVSLDPVFLDFGMEEKAELVFRALSDIYNSRNLGSKKTFMSSFDYFYSVQHGLGLAASQRANGKQDIARRILKEVVDRSRKRVYESILMKYLENSAAKELLA